MVWPLLKVKGKILVIRHSICRCVHAVMRLLKWLITLFVPYERNWFVAIRILLRLLHTETRLDCNCTLPDLRVSPRGSRKRPNFSDVLSLPYSNTHTQGWTVIPPCCDVGGSPSERSVATRYGYTVPCAYTYVGIKHGLTMQFKWKRQHLHFCRHIRTTAQSPSCPECANLPLQIFCYRFKNSSHRTTLWLRVILISLPVVISLIIWQFSDYVRTQCDP